MLAIKQLESGYESTPVLHGVNLDVSSGEFVAVIGANGAGKSTLLNTIAGLIAPWSGDVLLKGNAVGALDSHALVELGLVLVPEGRQVFPRMSVADNLALGAYTARARTARDRNEAWVYELFPRLAERREQMAATLSGGEQQMVALGRSLMAEPELLLLDEPSLGLAPVAVDAIFEPLAELRGQLTTLVVEQDAGRALELCDRGYVIEQGRVVLSGTSEELSADARLQAAYLGLEVEPT